MPGYQSAVLGPKMAAAPQVTRDAGSRFRGKHTSPRAEGRGTRVAKHAAPPAASPFATPAARAPKGEEINLSVRLYPRHCEQFTAPLARRGEWITVASLLAMTARTTNSIFKQQSGCAFAFSRHDLPEFCFIFHPLELERAQGKPGADRTRGSRAKKARGRTTGSTGITPAFPARWFYGLLRALPGDRAFLPPSSLRSLLLKNLAPASGRQDHTTSPSAIACARLSQAPRPPHPTARS
jgi:hypothetical protein